MPRFRYLEDQEISEERWRAFMELEPKLCACCGCKLSGYERFAGRLRGLRKPVCLGCAYTAVVWMRDHLFPLCEMALGRLEAEAEAAVER